MHTLLVVDDDPQIRAMLADLFTFEGYEVLLAANGEECLDVLRKRTCDLVLLDILMPEKEGIQTYLDLQKITPDVPVIAISGGGKIPAGEYLDTAQRLGMAAVLEKPLDLDTLLRTVRNTLGETVDSVD